MVDGSEATAKANELELWNDDEAILFIHAIDCDAGRH
jgi:hypothetical protein